jgi:exodeoxyribonuclease V alpha subunit
MKVVLCAPTGRAAKRMSEATGEQASTIHRLLEIKKIDDNNAVGRLDYPISPIDGDVVIVDEMSMVDVFMMNYILKGIYLSTKLILLGDSNQLPSVGPGNVLKDMIEAEKITTIELNKIFRQAAKSKIIMNSHKVNQGCTFTEKNIEEDEQLQDFFYINETSQDKILNEVISLCTGRLQKYGDYEFFGNIQVLTPTKKGKLGTKELNKSLQDALNHSKVEKLHGDRVFKKGDRVMQIKNNYEITWTKRSKSKIESGEGIFNGELGIVTKIDEELKNIEIVFDDDKYVIYEFSELDQIEHSYSITIHKSQRKRI